MHHSIRPFCATILLVLAGLVSNSFAQDTRFAFVNKERTLIFVHEGEQRDTLFQPIPSLKFRAERLAVLGSTTDGKALMVGGKIFYAQPGSGQQTSVQGFFRIPLPFDPAKFLTDGRILRQVYENTTKILPLGVITSDNQRWYGVWMSAAPNNPSFKIYSGNFNENGTLLNTDSAVVDGAAAMSGGYHMSNITTTEDGNKVMFVVLDKLTSFGLERARVARWNPKIDGQTVAMSEDGGLASQLRNVNQEGNVDKGFGFAVKGYGTSEIAKLRLAVMIDTETINIYEMQNASNPTLNPNQIKGTLSRHSLPAGLTFFTGYTGNADDVYSEAPQQGNGGDMMFSRDGSKVIFVTHENPEDQNFRNQSSAIFELPIEGGNATLLWNDMAASERQPVFVDGTGIAPKPEQKLTVSSSIMMPDSILIGEDTTVRFTITNTGEVAAEVTQVSLGSSMNYEISANSHGVTPPHAFTLTVEQPSAWFDVKFTPSAKAKYETTFTVRWSTDSVSTRTITGFGKPEPQDPKSVDRSYTEVFEISVSPNPLTTASVVTLKGVQNANASLELIDVNGRTVWSTSTKLNAGSTATFDLNANELSSGSYYLIVRAADVQTMRQVVVR